jgi:hypothetical protein
MRQRSIRRERHVWIAVVAVLWTSLSWLAAIDLALLVGANEWWARAWVVVRALLTAARAILEQGLPVAAAASLALAVAGALLILSSRPASSLERERLS